MTAERKRQVEFIAFLEQLDREIPATIKTIHVVLDNLRMHKGKQVQAWLAKHPRFVFHHPPVHCSWMNQVEQWFSILQRKRLRIADFADKAALAERLQAFIAEWNQVAHPFNWSTKSVAKVMAKCKRTEAPPEEEPTRGGVISTPFLCGVVLSGDEAKRQAIHSKQNRSSPRRVLAQAGSDRTKTLEQIQEQAFRLLQALEPILFKFRRKESVAEGGPSLPGRVATPVSPHTPATRRAQ